MDNIDELKNKLKESVDDLEKSLQNNHNEIEAKFYNNRLSILNNLKSYLVNISIITATLIPFSSLVFQIPNNQLIISVKIWIISLLILILSLIIFIYCFLTLIKIDTDSYIKQILEFFTSADISYLRLSSKEPADKVTDLTKILEAQSSFAKIDREKITEEQLVNIRNYIYNGSLAFIFGIVLFFLSIVFHPIINFLSSVCI